MKKKKVPGNDGTTNDVMKIGGPQVIKYMTKVYNKVLKSKEIPILCWKEAKVIIIHKKGDPKDIKSYHSISPLSHSYKIFTRLLQKRMERILDENRPRELAGFRKNFSTTDHLQALNQLIEKCNEFNLPLCLALIDYEKASDSVEHAAIVQALRKVNINENYVTMIESIYKGATARIHIDNQISEAFEIQRGVRQGKPISPKLFITVIEQVFNEADLKYGINIDGEYLRDLRFADDVALCTEKEEMEEHLERLKSENKNGDGQDTLLEKKTIDGLKDAQSGNQGQEEETRADRKQDGWMTSREQQVHNGRGTHKIKGNGRHLQRATSCSGWTKPPSNQVSCS
ncbi:dysbindin-like [Plakobranchus ocellatus]|uniref:Dysbindin-like n=1 Tax=Plakobranchus ocellatus TaxID=259542 RepID=A0AAV4AFS8_9GAST|nr:dysbindin-like [Plakobranchus ocellatus]